MLCRVQEKHTLTKPNIHTVQGQVFAGVKPCSGVWAMGCDHGEALQWGVGHGEALQWGADHGMWGVDHGKALQWGVDYGM